MIRMTWRDRMRAVLASYKAEKHPERFVNRLQKYKNGQIEFHGLDEIWRGQMQDIVVMRGRVRFELAWIAQWCSLPGKLENPEGYWKYTSPIPHLKHSLDVEPADETELTSGEVRDLSVNKFFQNKSCNEYPKQMFLSTERGEIAILFQPNDPRNFSVSKDGDLTVPSS